MQSNLFPFCARILRAPWFACIPFCTLILLSVCAEGAGLGGGQTTEKQAEKAREFYASAQEYLQKGDDKSAVLELKNTLQADPGFGEARLLLGKVYLDLWAPQAAEKELLAAAELGVPRQEWVIDLGQSYLRSGQAQKIISDIEPLTDDPPGLASRILTLRAEAYMQMGEFKNAKAELHSAEAQQAGHLPLLLANARLALRANRFDDAVNYMVEAGKIGQDDAEFWTITGDIAMRLGRTKAALNAFSRATELQPGYIQPRLAKAALLVHERDTGAATRELNTLKQLAPGLGQIYYLEALVALQEKDLKKAEAALLKQMKRTPNHLIGNLILGTLYYDTGQYNSAVRHINVYYWEYPDNRQVAKLLANVHQRLGDYSAAIDILLAHTPDSGDDAALLAQLGTLYLQIGKPAEADSYLERAISQAPDNAMYHYQLALAKLAQGQNKAATEYLEQARELKPDLVRAELVLTVSYFKQGDYERALSEATAMLEKRPEDPMANGLAGTIYAAMGDTDSAQKYFNNALKYDPDSAGALLSLATIDAQAGDIAGAGELYRKTLAADPTNARAAMKLAEIAEMRGDPEEALQLLQQFHSRNPAEIQTAMRLAGLYNRMKHPQKAVDVVTQLAITHPGNALVAAYLADAQMAAGQIDDAYSTLSKLVKEHPENAPYRVKLAHVQFLQKDYGPARENLERAIELGGQSPSLLLALGTLSLRESKTADAIAIAGELKEKYPESAHGYQLEGDIQSVSGEKALALASYERAYQLAPSANLALLRANFNNSLSNHQGAINTLQEWLDAHPKDTNVRVALANEYLRQGSTQEARQAFEELLESNYRHPIVLNNLAVIYTEAGDKRSVALSEEAYKADPKNADFLDTYGWALSNHGDPKRGLKLIEKAADIAPDNPNIRFHLAAAYHLNGNNDAARIELETLQNAEVGTQYTAEAAALTATLAEPK